MKLFFKYYCSHYIKWTSIFAYYFEINIFKYCSTSCKRLGTTHDLNFSLFSGGSQGATSFRGCHRTRDGIYSVIPFTSVAWLRHMFSKYMVSSRTIAMATGSLCSVKCWQSVGRVCTCRCESVCLSGSKIRCKNGRDEGSNNNERLHLASVGIDCGRTRIMNELIYIDKTICRDINK